MNTARTPFSPAFKNHAEHTALLSYKSVCYLIIALSLLIRFFFIGTNDLLVEEAYYWNYASHLDISYLDHPPMIALLIKVFTTIAGNHEFGVRIASILCWFLTALFSFKLTDLIKPGAGLYAVVLLAILPFFFLQSLVMTPDQPLLVCWSATLYCLYRSLVLNERRYWYGSGLALGLGMLSKYTIVLLGPAALLYLCLVPEARYWFNRKEPYIALLMAALLFTPVIYWNAAHEWASFVFQSTRRLNAAWSFSLHHLFGLLVLFLTPIGIIGLFSLFKKTNLIDQHTQRFFQAFFLIPLIVFGLFSLTHEVKFNWIGPDGLAVVPWLAIIIHGGAYHRGWLITGTCSLFLYLGLMIGITFGTPLLLYQTFLTKFIAWDVLTKDLYAIVEGVAHDTHKTPIVIPLDQYNIGSELSFYQAKLFDEKQIGTPYPIVGRHVFGGESLMYRYWAGASDYNHHTAVLISTELRDFENPELKKHIVHDSPVKILWSYSQGLSIKNKPYYYEIVELKDPLPGLAASSAAKPNENRLNNLK